MFNFVAGLALYDSVAPRRVYDNPPVIVSVPRWPRLRTLAATAGALGTHGRRATAPAASCGSSCAGVSAPS